MNITMAASVSSRACRFAWTGVATLLLVGGPYFCEADEGDIVRQRDELAVQQILSLVKNLVDLGAVGVWENN